MPKAVVPAAPELSTKQIAEIKANLFHAAHPAIDNWCAFPWHRDPSGKIDATKVHSSQALAIDVFGTLRVNPERHALLGALAHLSGVPGEGPWKLELEWTDQSNLLGEKRPTQVDAIAFGARSILVIECKFTEPGGGCSQTTPTPNGPLITTFHNATVTMHGRRIHETAK
ncbi:PGN_0703 family putative restriction endonuclease [Bradyrhizobium liaoningense]|uniref:PGN_0703 family putative restriction endonuclease n=1 Tax=Bradyrhizobium liaoningense TaxID=43992 RepID=UPI002011DE32|nr:hypothetical protein [Bradyrhizobium liaoningense]